MQTLVSIWAWFSIAALIVIWVPIMFVVHLLDRDPARYRTGRWFRRLGAAMTRANPMWSVQVSGYRPPNPRHPFVVVGNHQSLADIPVFSRLPWDMKWVGKAEVFRVPVIGWMMRLSLDIPVERDNRRSRAAVMIQASKRLKENVSIMIMPEGTRSPDGRVGTFNDGAFALAIRSGVPVLPVAMDGTIDALPRDNWRFGSARDIRLHVFEPVPVDGLSTSDAADLREQVRQMIVAKIAAWRGVPPSEVDAL
ncbi:MAG: 1-acyl-sn-glycerol-3-phosphate acyltransferase [Rhodothermales bacterium]|nr:1-acyl-sn-glycerol-3-phosphate acyltransferase [Rhodothermales bacterium]MBO6778606.1 1-acyl-sn-glycerol-3-phosphate acyltransferase [Rhodothermales bacterium]